MNSPLFRIAAGLVVLLFVLSIGFVAIMALATNIDGPSYEQGVERAGPLIFALEQYRQGYGKHPEELQMLIPDFLDSVPKPGWRFEYYYDVCTDGVGYVIAFPLGSSDDVCGFDSELEEWECRDSNFPFDGLATCRK